MVNFLKKFLIRHQYIRHTTTGNFEFVGVIPINFEFRTLFRGVDRLKLISSIIAARKENGGLEIALLIF
jgi:hypothetical protein